MLPVLADRRRRRSVRPVRELLLVPGDGAARRRQLRRQGRGEGRLATSSRSTRARASRRPATEGSVSSSRSRRPASSRCSARHGYELLAHLRPAATCAAPGSSSSCVPPGHGQVQRRRPAAVGSRHGVQRRGPRRAAPDRARAPALRHRRDVGQPQRRPRPRAGHRRRGGRQRCPGAEDPDLHRGHDHDRRRQPARSGSRTPTGSGAAAPCTSSTTRRTRRGTGTGRSSTGPASAGWCRSPARSTPRAIELLEGARASSCTRPRARRSSTSR